MRIITFTTAFPRIETMDDFGSYLWIFFYVAVIGGLAWVAIHYIRGWLKQDEDFSGGGGFSIGDLRKLHRDGKMSDAEFEKARAIIVGRSAAAMNSSPTPANNSASPAPSTDSRGRGFPPIVPSPPPTGSQPDSTARPGSAPGRRQSGGQ
jgi:hypothetical protein